MKRRFTRRNLVRLAAAVPAAGAISEARQPAASNPSDERTAILAQFKTNAESIAKVKLPATTEPAVHFKA